MSCIAASVAKASITPWSVVLRTSAGSRPPATILHGEWTVADSDAALDGEHQQHNRGDPRKHHDGQIGGQREADGPAT